MPVQTRLSPTSHELRIVRSPGAGAPVLVQPVKTVTDNIAVSIVFRIMLL